MNPCYIITYSLTGPCAVNVKTIVQKVDQPQGQFPKGRCLIHFQDGSNLLLDEACEAIDLKAPNCTIDAPGDMPVYG